MDWHEQNRPRRNAEDEGAGVVLASRTLGAGNGHIIFKEILPNTIGPIITQVMFSIPTAIFTEALLSFVGVGIVLALLMLGFNFIGDGLREALAPKLEDM